MRLYYLILAHKDLDQVLRMIDALSCEQAVFYIHVDKKVPWKLVKSFFLNRLDIKVIRNRFDVHWGGFKMIQATLSLLKASIKDSEKAYFILLSGQDFPIKTPKYIVDFLSQNYGNQYLEHFSLPNDKWLWNGGLDRINNYWLVDKLGLDLSYSFYFFQKRSGISRPYFTDFPPYGGSQWWCLTQECVKYILDFLNSNKIFQEYFELSFIPDETFFNTIILNSIFKPKVINDNLKFIKWKDGNAHPELLTKEDFPQLLRSTALWARKIDSNIMINALEGFLNKH